MNEHLEHQFKHTGGGTMLDTLTCDDSYACECGATMHVDTLTPAQHFAMPDVIRVERREQVPA